MRYRVFDLVVDSEIALLDFEQASTGTPSLTVDNTADIRSDVAWVDVWRQESRALTLGDLAWKFAWDGSDLLIALPNCGAFRLTSQFRALQFQRAPNASDFVLSSQLTYNLIPRALGEGGHFVIHASCIALEDGGCLVFTGPSGAGKSTLAASFSGAGGDLVSDDCVLLRCTDSGLSAFVTGGNARLWDDSLTNLVGEHDAAVPLQRTRRRSKWNHQFATDRTMPGSLKVRAIFDLAADTDPEAQHVVIAPLTTGQFLSLMLERMMLFDEHNRRTRGTRFDRVTAVAQACPAVFNLRYPRTFDRLADVRRQILEHVNRPTPASIVA